MSINANTSVLEYERLTAERAQARLARKAINRERYRRRYLRICEERFAAKGRGECTLPWWQVVKLVRVSDIVTITVGPLIHVYGPIGSDNLL